MEAIGYLLFTLMGTTLGLIGAGGGILSIPILIYIFHVPILLATTYSFFIVGSTTLIGMWDQKNEIAYKQGLLFALPSLLGVYMVRGFIVPELPAELLGISRDHFILGIFVFIMLASAYAMYNQKKEKASRKKMTFIVFFKVILLAYGFGCVIGLLGIGGGFLVIPALVLFEGLAMKRAIATSLFIITLNCVVGFIIDKQPLGKPDFELLLIFTILAIIGLLIGGQLNKKLSGEKLKKGFAVFIVIIALLITIKETCM